MAGAHGKVGLQSGVGSIHCREYRRTVWGVQALNIFKRHLFYENPSFRSLLCKVDGLLCLGEPSDGSWGNGWNGGVHRFRC